MVKRKAGGIPFKKGNKFWQIRSKHGQDRLFKSPELLWEAACEYFQWVDDNPEYESKPMVISIGNNSGSEVVMEKVPKKQPYTLQDLCSYLGVVSSYFRVFKATLQPKQREFLTVIERIEETIYSQKFRGASSGFFNANLISRDLGLAEQVKMEQTARVTVSNVFEPLEKISDDKKKT